ncbi:hypothetical protein [Streptomyces sp. NPDC059916]|uniref:hypothetical protein n=1 Tax=Streptomyces sp. NPDC059916 TaxID=3347001 RepID=UPI0036AB5097
MATTIRRTSPALAAAVTIDLHGLPAVRITASDTAAHIVTAQLGDLTTWLTARGGYTTRERCAGGITHWTLRTSTEPRGDGSTTPVLVHALALTHEDVPYELVAALA